LARRGDSDRSKPRRSVDKPAVQRRDRGIVLDDQYAPRRLRRGDRHEGSLTVTVVPPLRTGSTSIDPWERRTMFWTSVSPIPLWPGFVVKSRSKILSTSSTGIPLPQSRTRKTV